MERCILTPSRCPAAFFVLSFALRYDVRRRLSEGISAPDDMHRIVAIVTERRNYSIGSEIPMIR